MFVAIVAIVFTGHRPPIGIYSAVNRYSPGDVLFTFIGFIGLAVPSFLLALVLMYMSVVVFGASVGGLFSNEYINAPWSLAKFLDLLGHLPIPAIVIGFAGMAQLIRIMRANLLDELRKPYVITARAKGLSERRVILKYPVRVALNPFASTVGFLFPQVVSGRPSCRSPEPARSVQCSCRPGRPRHAPGRGTSMLIGRSPWWHAPLDCGIGLTAIA